MFLRNWVFAGSVLGLLLVSRVVCAEEKMTPELLLQRHLDSIGPAAARAAATTRVVEGAISYRLLVGGAGQYEGRAFVVSQGNKLQLRLRVNAPEYLGERFLRDGDKTDIASSYANKTRSELANLLESDDAPLREGLIGGVLSTGWPLLDLDAHKSTIKYQGLKKVDGIDLHVVTYIPKRSTGLEITLYFDPATLHHVRTVYLQNKQAAIVTSPFADIVNPPGSRNPERLNGPDARSARQGPTWWRIEEQFDNFITVDGLTLPARYDLRFQQQLPNGSTKTIDWDVKTTRVLNNVSVDARNFQMP